MALSVILPAYNEAANLRALVPEIIDVCADLERGPFEVIVVDDGSTDATATRATEAAARYDPLRFVQLQANYGQSAALAAGMDHARGAVVVPMDADGQNDPADIPRLLDRIDAGADCVSGWRRDRDDPLSKRVPSRIQTRLAMLTGPDIHDFGCTLTAYRRDAIEELDLRGERHRYTPAQLHQLGYDVTEIEVAHHERAHGETKYGAGRLLRGFVDLVYHVFRSRFVARPMHVFGGVGVAILLAGLALGGWLLVENYLLGAQLLPNLPQLLLAVGMTLFGFGLIALGIITELLTELLYEDERPYRVERVIE
jgi:glycosyltransferase involved in cell wall biosynthesis